MPDPIARTYLSLGAFYASDPARRTSRERDVGLFWRSEQGPTFRAAYVHDTGELYLFQHALGGRGGGSVRLFAERMTEAELDVRLEGWEDVCGRKGSYEWLLERMGAAAPVPPTTAAGRPALPAPRPHAARGRIASSRPLRDGAARASTEARRHPLALRRDRLARRERVAVPAEADVGRPRPTGSTAGRRRRTARRRA